MNDENLPVPPPLAKYYLVHSGVVNYKFTSPFCAYSYFLFFFKVTKQEYTGETDVPMQQDADADMYNTKRDPIEISDTPSPSPAPSVITISSDSEPETEVAPKR